MLKPIAILLGGFKASESSKPKGLRYVKAFAFLLLLLTFNVSEWIPLGQLLTVREAQATHIVSNSAGVDWTDNVGNYYITVWDTASVRVFLQPNLVMTKDVMNISSGNSSSDVVNAVRGDTIEFIIKIVNNGNTEALSVVMADSIPAGTEYMVLQE